MLNLKIRKTNYLLLALSLMKPLILSRSSYRARETTLALWLSIGDDDQIAANDPLQIRGLYNARHSPKIITIYFVDG